MTPYRDGGPLEPETTTRRRYRCVAVGDWPVALELSAIYDGAPEGRILRIVDESAASYLYPPELFERVETDDADTAR